MFSDLPLEILREIIIWSIELPGKPCLRSLCMISKIFCGLVQPILHSHVVLRQFPVPARQRSAFLREFAKGAMPACWYAKQLIIDCSGSFTRDPEKDCHEAGLAAVGHFVKALRAFKSIKKVIWEIGQFEPAWLHKFILEALSGLGAEELVVLFKKGAAFPEIPLGSLRGIRRLCIEYDGYSAQQLTTELEFQAQITKLIAQSPNLSSLELDLRAIRFSTFMRCLKESDIIFDLSLEHLGLLTSVEPEDFTLLVPHLRRLRSLILHHNIPMRFVSRDADFFARIWLILRRENIHLLHLGTDYPVQNSFISYVSSFTGLQSLRLAFEPARTYFPIVTRKPLEFFQSLVDNHSDSLAELDLRGYSGAEDWMWPFSKEAITVLSSLRNLLYFGATCPDYTQIQNVEATAQQNLKDQAPFIVADLISFSEQTFKDLSVLTIHYNTKSEKSTLYRSVGHNSFKHRSASFVPTESVFHDIITSYNPRHDPLAPPFKIMMKGGQKQVIYVCKVDPATNRFSYSPP